MSRYRRHGLLVPLPFVLVLALAASGAAGAAEARTPSPPPPEGPWPPSRVLAADPAEPHAVAAAVVDTACPATTATVRHYAPGGGKTVALTFDDGPGPGTLPILSILQRYGVTATFFNIGTNAKARPQPVRATAAVGAPLGNHTWDHPRMPTLSASGQATQMDSTSSEQVSTVGTAPCLFRPPYGEYDATTLSVATQRRMGVWNWSVDTEDWKAGTSTAASWVRRIVTRATAGGSQTHPVILMHNPPTGIPATVTALPEIITYYRDHGYRFVDLRGRPSQRAAPAVTVTAAGVQLADRTTAGALRVRTRRGATWSPWVSLGGTLVGAPAASAVGTATSAFVTLATDNTIRRRTRTDAGTAGDWADLGGTATSRPAVTWSKGTETVAVRGTDAGVRLRSRTADGWGPWESIGGRLASGPALASTADGGLTVAGVGTDNVLWVRHRGATWSPWKRLGGPSVTAEPALAATADGKGLVAVVRGPDDSARAIVGNAAATTWGPWRSLGGRLSSGPAVTARGSTVEVYGYGTNGRIYQDVASDGAAATGWSGWRALP